MESIKNDIIELYKTHNTALTIFVGKRSYNCFSANEVLNILYTLKDNDEIHIYNGRPWKSIIEHKINEYVELNKFNTYYESIASLLA